MRERARRTLAAVGLLAALGAAGAGPASADTFTGSNPTNLTVPDANTASATSAINVSGLGGGTLSSASVTLNGVSHQRPSDLDVLLVSPNNLKAIVMSDACGSGIIAASLTLVDSAAAPLPLAGPCPTGSYQPVDYVGCEIDGADVLPAPAPMGIDGIALSTFNGANPNGTWTLYVADACAAMTGAITGGWALTLNTSLPTPPTPTPAAPAPITTSPAPKPAKKRCKKRGKKGTAAKRCKKRK